MSRKVILSADRTCDLGEELRERYNLNFIPYHIILNNNEYIDSVDIYPDDIFKAYRENGVLPKTSAINVSEYIDYFTPFIEAGYEVVHLNLAATLSSSHQNCLTAAAELDGVYPVNSCNLSTGTGLLVLEASEMISKGMSAAEIANNLNSMTAKSHASFVLETLEFLRAGGRCSTIAELGANLLKLRPCIEVDGTGAMGLGKLYRGNLDKVLLQYTEDQMNRYPDIKTDRVFVTHSGISQERIDSVVNALKSKNLFDEIFVTRASCTISAHCGPNTLGVLFMTR